MKKTKSQLINPDEWYTMQDIFRAGMFPWAPSLWAVRNLVAMDRRNKNILKANITGTGRATKYHFKGKNIIELITQFEAGKVRL